MNSIHKKLMMTVLGLGLGLSVTQAKAWFVYDAYRTGEFALQSVQRLLSMVSEYQKVASKKQELELWENRVNFKKDEGENGASDGDGNASEGGEGSGSEGELKLPQSYFYEYMSGAGTCSMGSNKYLQYDSDSENMETNVESALLYDSDLSTLTEEDKEKVIQTRLSYVRELAQEVLSLSYGARQNIQAELTKLKESETTAGGDVNQVDVMVHTKKVMVEQKAADLMLQAKLLELEAAELLFALSPQKIENPNENE